MRRPLLVLLVAVVLAMGLVLVLFPIPLNGATMLGVLLIVFLIILGGTL